MPAAAIAGSGIGATGNGMLDGEARKWLNPALDRMGRALAARGVPANAVTIAGFLLGVIAALFIVFQQFWLALALIAVSRLADGLDGAVARATAKTDFGGYLDIVLDFAFYGLVPLAFVIADPDANAIAGAVLLVSFYVNGASFLAFAILAERHGMQTMARGEKSLFFSTGLAEASETILVFAAMCIWPSAFPVLAWLFAALTLYTALSRIILTARSFAPRG